MSDPFWSNTGENQLDPFLKSRFKVSIGNTFHWWARSVTQPTVDISVNEYQLINHKIKIPGIATWNDIDIVFYEIGEKGQELYKKLVANGYKFTGIGGNDGIQKKDLDVKIEKFAPGGGKDTQETWELKNAMIKSINFSDLDYSSDDLVEITLSVAYDSATLS